MNVFYFTTVYKFVIMLCDNSQRRNTYMAVSIKQLKPGNAYTENTDLFLCIFWISVHIFPLNLDLAK